MNNIPQDLTKFGAQTNYSQDKYTHDLFEDQHLSYREFNQIANS